MQGGRGWQGHRSRVRASHTSAVGALSGHRTALPQPQAHLVGQEVPGACCLGPTTQLRNAATAVTEGLVERGKRGSPAEGQRVFGITLWSQAADPPHLCRNAAQQF
jgi:hypothetical protein